MEKSISSKVKYQWLFASFFIGIACWLTFSVLTMVTGAVAQLQVDNDFDSSVPRAALSPSDVVSLQVRSIRASVEDLAKLKVCYSLASHENRRQTGPFSRFSNMVKVPPYDHLATCVDWQLGGTVVDKEFATVLVSTVSKEGDICGFRFILQRQNCNNETCWMTEGVDHLVELSVDRKRREETELGLGIE
jgi:hypothetical protein